MTGSLIVGGVVVLFAVALYLREKNGMPTEDPSSEPEPSSAPKNRPIFSARLLTKNQEMMADLIVREATAAGINPAFMVALAVTESSLDPSKKGDDYLSFGLFQLNKKFISASDPELLDPQFNIEAALEKMRLLMRSFPGHSYGDYAEAWTLGGAGRFRKNRRNPAKWTNMQKAIDDLSLDLYLTENP
jgi:hypothetical protein